MVGLRNTGVFEQFASACHRQIIKKLKLNLLNIRVEVFERKDFLCLRKGVKMLQRNIFALKKCKTFLLCIGEISRLWTVKPYRNRSSNRDLTPTLLQIQAECHVKTQHSLGSSPIHPGKSNDITLDFNGCNS